MPSENGKKHLLRLAGLQVNPDNSAASGLFRGPEAAENILKEEVGCGDRI
jgi:hypothetical protein